MSYTTTSGKGHQLKVWRWEGIEGLKSDLPVSLKDWKSFLWNAVQHLLHPTHTVLHHHIRGDIVKENKGAKIKPTQAVCDWYKP